MNTSDLFIESGDRHPSVIFDPQEGILEIKGASVMKHPRLFYRQVFLSLKHWSKTNTQDSFTANLYLSSLNDGSLLVFYQLFRWLQLKQPYAVVHWYVVADYPDGVITGKQFKEDFPMLDLQIRQTTIGHSEIPAILSVPKGI
ncbi:SiaC family regulatory phosphoprotein [uncultured Microscilla sp.]|uniref:SiaC family regulatory phosphoprotein n=1 Tax=uncultured Microscilla sp. TaxID=432653 RepID=UPI00261E9F22|nr:SiaC family regulatory phosphoprotein [uncultured Microscilla sp.]